MMDRSPAQRPAFLLTIDTEGDNLWARGDTITTRNAEYLPAFQQLCEQFGLRPTWLTNWEMVHCPRYVTFARDVLARDRGEIGMHLHAWNNPPLIPLTQNDNRHHPYLIEYPETVMRQKVRTITDALENTFQRKMVSHRAGRFSFDERYARILVEHGYTVDCSVTPHVSWKPYPGDPAGSGGTDFTRFPEGAYFVDLQDISRPGASNLLEVPVTVTEPYFRPAAKQLRCLLEHCGLGRVGRRLVRPLAWLYPMGHNHRLMPRLLRAALRDGRDFVEFMIHSSELMPGGGPRFPTQRSIRRLFRDLHSLFAFASQHFEPMTLSQYRLRFTRMPDSPAASTSVRNSEPALANR